MEVVKRSAGLQATSSLTNWISSTGGIFSWSEPFRYATRTLHLSRWNIASVSLPSIKSSPS